MNIPIKKIDLNQIIVDINDLNFECNNYKKKSLYNDQDTRNLIFTLLSNEIQFLLLGVTLSKNLNSIDFYRDNGYKTENINEQYLQSSLMNFLDSTSNSYFALMFIQLENYIRLVAEKIGQQHFNISITYNNLKTRYNLSENISNLLKIILNIRNSMHNGGFYTHPDSTINYKGIDYTFTQNQPIFYGGLQMGVFFTKELLSEFISEINSKSSSETFIEHNYTSLNFDIEEN